MKKRIISIILTLAMLVAIAVVLPVTATAVEVWDGTTATPFEGEGTLYSPYIIRNAENLKQLQILVEGGNNFAGKYIVLANDIDLGGKEWTPIGSRGTDKTSFTGVFDGNGFTVRGFSITKYVQYSGLFGVVASTATNTAVVSNVTVEGSIVLDNTDAFADHLYVGGIIGWTETPNVTKRVIVSNCTSKVNMTIDKSTTGNKDIYLGGIVGRVYSVDLIDCTNEGNITGKLGGSTAIFRLGGIGGANYNSTLLNCVNKGTIDVWQNSAAKKIDYVGGLLGLGATASGSYVSTLTNCANLADVTAENAAEDQIVSLGGMIGSFYMHFVVIENCYNTGTIKGIMPVSEKVYCYVGGVTGYNDSGAISVVIKNTYNSGEIFAIGGKDARAGGIVGVGYARTPISPSPAMSLVENCQTTTSKIVGYSNPELLVNNQANISNETFNGLIAPIDAAIAAGAGYDFTSNITNLGDSINISTNFRASIRLIEGSNGLRFTTEIDNAMIESLNTEHGAGNYTIGTLITPLSYVQEAGGFTVAKLNALTKSSAKYINVVADVNAPYAITDDGLVFAGSIANIKVENFDLEFAAIGYVLVGSEYTYSNVYTARSVLEIAQAALADTSEIQTSFYNYATDITGVYSPYTPEQQQVLKGYLPVE